MPWSTATCWAMKFSDVAAMPYFTATGAGVAAAAAMAGALATGALAAAAVAGAVPIAFGAAGDGAAGAQARATSRTPSMLRGAGKLIIHPLLERTGHRGQHA